MWTKRNRCGFRQRKVFSVTETVKMDLIKVLEGGATTHSLALHPVEPMEEDKDGNIWYGTFGNGIFKINSHTFAYQPLYAQSGRSQQPR